MSGEKVSWKCSNCGHTLDAAAPPDPCPSCGAQCEFINVSCYTPDCGGPGVGAIDGRLDGDKDVQ